MRNKQDTVKYDLLRIGELVMALNDKYMKEMRVAVDKENEFFNEERTF